MQTAANDIFALSKNLLSAVKTKLGDQKNEPRNITALPNVASSADSSGDFFIRMSIDLLKNTKEYKRNENLRSTIQASIKELDRPESANALTVFGPFHLVCNQQNPNPELVTIAIDCLGKLFTYNFWKFAADIHISENRVKANKNEVDGIQENEDDDGTSEMISFVINTICDSFLGESTDEKVQLQIIKALQAALTNSDPSFSLHGAILLKAIRTTYNIFLLSNSNNVQTIAQVTVLQMMQNVLSRIPSDLNGPVSAFDREIKDAFKVIRTLCILSVKPLPALDGAIELRSGPIRSKLLALHLLAEVIDSNASKFFVTATPIFSLFKDAVGPPEHFRFIDAVKEFLILSLTRNATSMVLPIFEASMKLFSIVWSNFRHVLKREMAVFFTEIIIPILEGGKTPWYQRRSLLKSFSRLFSGPEGAQMLVEIFLNYDCDPEATAKENIWDRVTNALGMIASQHMENPIATKPQIVQCFNHRHPTQTPALTTNNLLPLSREQVKDLFAVTGDHIELRKQAVLLMSTGIVSPLHKWCWERIQGSKKEEIKEKDTSSPTRQKDESVREDDPVAISYLKQKKEQLIDGIKQFNLNPKKGIQMLLKLGCISSNASETIALFLLETEGLNKAQIGDYLGEGIEENIAIMHAFVDLQNFSGLSFVEGLRKFLNKFRLPGEAQKIDRFMLKFAARYLEGNPGTFSSADTAYVLAYSTIMLNTDQHNAQVKKKMSKLEFIKNNRGIDGGKDLPEERLSQMFDEISKNEIILNDELPAKKAALIPKDGSASQPSDDIALKTEQMMRKGLKRSNFITANHHEHIKSMLEKNWMTFLASFSNSLKESHDDETSNTCLEGIKNSIRIFCIFQMETEKDAFVSMLSTWTLQQMREKNLQAIHTLFDIALSEGEYLQASWKEIIACLSQLEKLRDHQIHLNTDEDSARTQIMTLPVDKIFISSPKLSGSAIVHFVRALCEVSNEEISSSLNEEQPRMYCLQRLVEISYYNMNRVRFEWSNMWSVLGHHFNQTGCHSNTNVALFALDRLRQLSMKFLELEELPNFKFQMDFLRPFEEIVKGNPNLQVKDMCLVSIQQIIQVKGKTLRSGWKTLCGSIMRAARETHEPIVLLAYEITKSIAKNSFESIAANGTLYDFISLLGELFKTPKSLKISLPVFDILKQCTQKVAEAVDSAKAVVPENQIAVVTESKKDTTMISVEEDACVRLWMPVFFGLNDIVMTCDLEIRTKALSYLFENLKTYGSTFPISFWQLLCKGVLFALFANLKQPFNNDTNALDSKFKSKEEHSVWVSTTLIQALRLLVDLFTFYYEKTHIFMLPDLCDLLKCCLRHENEALSRIGSTCLQQMLEQNATKFDQDSWDTISALFYQLVDETNPKFLFFKFSDDPSLEERFKFLNQPLSLRPDKKEFQAQISICAVHLLVIETIQQTLSKLETNLIPKEHLRRMLLCFQSSYDLAHIFNESMDLRQALHKMGYMKQLPNLLKQEVLSVNAYLTLLTKLLLGSDKDLKESTKQIFIPLCLKILKEYVSFDQESKQRNISAWRPVIQTILLSISKLDEEDFNSYIHQMYQPIINLLLVPDLFADIRLAIYDVLFRAGKSLGIQNY